MPYNTLYDIALQENHRIAIFNVISNYDISMVFVLLININLLRPAQSDHSNSI